MTPLIEILKDKEHLTLFKEERNNIYILAQTSNTGFLYKIGYSKNIIQRLWGYYRHNPEIFYISSFLADREYEAMIHSIYFSKYGKEWYTEKVFKRIYKQMVEDLVPF